MFKKFIRDHKVHKKITSYSFFDFIFIYRPIYLLGPISMVLIGMYIGNFIQKPLELGVLTDIYAGLFILGISLIALG